MGMIHLQHDLKQGHVGVRTIIVENVPCNSMHLQSCMHSVTIPASCMLSFHGIAATCLPTCKTHTCACKPSSCMALYTWQQALLPHVCLQHMTATPVGHAVLHTYFLAPNLHMQAQLTGKYRENNPCSLTPSPFKQAQSLAHVA